VGLVRRHPEIRWRRTALDVEERAVLQWSLLLNAARHTENGGVLVYSVCSDLKAEGAAQIQKFLSAHPDFTLEPPAEAEYWQSVITDGTMQVNPHEHGCDGFFAARLRRRAV
jgi:16S rRNA (cytosine967-C5)-methyltransferase